jgi:hypothetical protein
MGEYFSARPDGSFRELMNAMSLDSTVDMGMEVPLVDAELGVAPLDVVGRVEGAVAVVGVAAEVAVAAVVVA